MVATMPSAVSGLTKQEAPSAGVVPGGNTRHCTALMQRYCEYIAPPRMATVLPISACAAGDAPAWTTTPAPACRTVGALSSAGMAVGGGHQGIHRLFRRVEGARNPDDAFAGGAAPGEAVALGNQPVPDRLRQADEDEVDLGGAPEPSAGNLRQPLTDPLGHGIGVAGVPEPQVVGDEGLELHGEEAHLREEVAAAPAAVAHGLGQLAVEEH